MLDLADPDERIAHAARLLALPAFPQAVREYTVGLARFRESPRLADKLISYDTRWRVVGYLLYLAADRARVPVLSDDDVVVHGDSKWRCDVDDRLGHLDVRPRRRPVGGRVIVDHNYRAAKNDA